MPKTFATHNPNKYFFGRRWVDSILYCFLIFWVSLEKVIMCLIGLLGDVSVTSRRRTTIKNRIKCCLFDHSRRKQQYSRCFHHSPHQVSFTMVSSSFFRLILLLCLVSSSFSSSSSASPSNSTAAEQTLRPQEELWKLNLIRQELQKINKPAVKTIQAVSPFLKFSIWSMLYTDLFVEFSSNWFIGKKQFFRDLLCSQWTCKLCYSVHTLFLLCFLLCSYSVFALF